MSTEATPNGTTPPATPQPAAASAPAKFDPDSPEAKAWIESTIGQRLERAKASVFKDLGFEKAEEAKAKLDAWRKRELEEQSEIDRLKATTKDYEEKQKRLAEASEALAEVAKEALAGLTETQRSAILALAGDDASAQLKALRALRPTWQAAAEAAKADADAAKAAAEAEKAKAGPAPTMPNGSGPPAPPQGTTDHKAIYQALKTTDPHGAAVYLMDHLEAIYPDRR